MKTWVIVVAACAYACACAGAAKPIQLAPMWRVAGEDPIVLDGRLFVREGDAWVERDPSTGVRRGELPSRSEQGSWLEYLEDASTRDLYVAREDGPWIVGVDPATAKQRWRTRCVDVETRCDVVGRRVRDRLVFLGTIEYRASEWSIGMVALDANTGHEAWRAAIPFADRAGLRLAADDDQAYALGRERVIAVAVGSGSVVWERRIADGLAVAAGAGVVAFAGDGGVEVVDVRRGDPVATLRWSGSVGALAIDRGTLYVMSDRGDPSSRIVAADLMTGNRRWEWSGRAMFPPLAIAEHSIYVRSAAAGIGDATDLVAIDRATGVEVARHPLGGVTRIAMLGGVVVAAGMGEVVALAPLPRTGAPRSITIRGAIVLRDLDPGSLPMSWHGARVRIGDAVVTADADGNFAATIPAIGVVPVTLLDRPIGIPWARRCVFPRVLYLRAWEWNPEQQLELIVAPSEPCPID